jgi:hypothetical protein
VVTGMPLSEFAAHWQYMAQQQQMQLAWAWQAWLSQMMQGVWPPSMPGANPQVSSDAGRWWRWW